MCFAPQRRALFQHLNYQKWSGPGVFCTFWLGNVFRATPACTFSTSEPPKWSVHGVLCTFWLGNVLRATTACTFWTSEPPKMVRTWCVLYILTSKCASRHNGVHFFVISTAKSGPDLVCFVHCTFWLGKCASRHNGAQLPKLVRTWCVFVHFDFEMCFAPQRRALFRHRNFQKWSEPLVFLNILTSKCASRHNGVQLFISHLASWLRTRRFSEPTFQPSGAPNHWENTVFRDFPTFSRIGICFLLTLFLFYSSSDLSLLSASSLLCFSSVHIVGSLTSKLPSKNSYWKWPSRNSGFTQLENGVDFPVCYVNVYQRVHG